MSGIGQPPDTGFDPIAALRALRDAGVEFVLIGGLAGRLWGSPSVTGDVDICARWDDTNRGRIAAVLQVAGATLRGAPDDLPFILDARTLGQGANFTFNTTWGPLDLVTLPAGGLVYDDLAASAVSFELDDHLAIDVVALDDLIHLKQSAARRKDLIEVEILEAVRDERRQRGLGS